MQKEIHFASDDFIIYGTLHLPVEKYPPTVIGAHGLLSSGESPKQIALAEACNKNGIAYFRFDHRGCGKSSGEFSAATTFDGRCRDLIHAIEIIKNHPDTGMQVGLFGSSYGGAVSLAVFSKFEPASIVTVAAPMKLDTIKPPYLNDLSNQTRLRSLDRNKLNFDLSGKLDSIKNILIFHGDEDEVVPFLNAEEIYQITNEPKKLIQLKHGDHPMSNPDHQKQFIQLTVGWYKDYFF